MAYSDAQGNSVSKSEKHELKGNYLILQGVTSMGKDMETNAIYCGDCKDVLHNFPDKSVDLIYVDPPFFTHKNYEIIWKDGSEIRSFKDAQWYSKDGKRREDIYVYLDWLKNRVEQCHRILKDTGSFYLHCDWHANSYIRVEILDKIFGPHNFRNEIIWRQTANNTSIDRYGPIHQTIFFYSKSSKSYFYPQLGNYTKDYIEKYFIYEDEKGRFRPVILTGSGIRSGESGTSWRGYNPTKIGRHWAIPTYLVDKYKKLTGKKLEKCSLAKKLDKFDSLGLIYWGKKKSNVPQYKYYLSDAPGVPYQDLWTYQPGTKGCIVGDNNIGIDEDVKWITTNDKEMLGYPTQKPEGILNRIIRSSSKPGDIVLDPMCGCGTTIASCQRLPDKQKRKWIGIDVSPTACKLMNDRLRKLGAVPKLIGMPATEVHLRKIPDFEFQNWVNERLGGRIASKKVGDMGIDGVTFDGTPIQSKRSDRVGRNVVDNFETAIRRYFGASKREIKGIIVAFSFTPGAYNEAHRAKLQHGLIIELKTVEELLKEK